MSLNCHSLVTKVNYFPRGYVYFLSLLLGLILSRFRRLNIKYTFITMVKMLRFLDSYFKLIFTALWP